MNDRQRLLATMHYGPRDRAPICDFGFWPETIVEWHRQGLPAWVHFSYTNERYCNQFFGMDAYTGGPGVHVGLCPGFEEKVLEDRGDYEVAQQHDGVRVLRKKFMGSIPQHEGHLLVDRASWNLHYKPRLNPAHPDRYPTNWDAAVKTWRDTSRANPCTLNVGSLYGWIRDWMGMEAVSMLVYDDPALFEEMVTAIADCVLETTRRALDTGGVFDAAAFWEDMCYGGGPLLSPAHFKQYLVPQYKRITGLLRSHGIDIIWVDCDGKIDSLVPLWMEAGVNCMFPIEVGTWGGDAVAFRRQYGKELLLIGGVDKHILSAGKRQIEAEVRRLAPLVEEGGYIPTPDHRVPPDVPYENYLHYLRTARAVWGKGVDLKPMGA